MNNELLRTLRPLILLTMASILLVGFFYVLFSYAFVRIDISGTSGKPVKVSILNSDNKVIFEQETEETSFSKFIKRDHITITATQDKNVSFTETEIGLLNNTKVAISLENQKQSSKIATDTTGCHAKTKTTVYSFGCISGDTISSHSYTNLGGVKKTIFSTSISSRFQPYDNGVVFNTSSDGRNSLSYYNMETKKFSQVLNDETVALSFNASVYVDDVYNSIAYLNNDTNEIHIIRNGKYSKTYKALDNLDSIPFAVTLVSVLNNKMYQYYGLSGTAPDSDEESDTYKKIKNGYLKIYDLDSDQTTIIKTPQNFKPESIHALNDNTLATYGDTEGVVLYEVNKNSLKQIIHFKGINQPKIVTDTGFYFIGNNNEIYFFNTKEQTVKLQYQETNIRVANINMFNNQLFFSGFSQDTGTLEHHLGFQLDTDKQAKYPRLESVLPYSRDEVPITTMDYNGKTLYVTLLLTSFSFDRTTNKPIIDAIELDNAKKGFLSRFKQDGFNPADYTIKFSY